MRRIVETRGCSCQNANDSVSVTTPQRAQDLARRPGKDGRPQFCGRLPTPEGNEEIGFGMPRAVRRQELTLRRLVEIHSPAADMLARTPGSLFVGELDLGDTGCVEISSMGFKVRFHLAGRNAVAKFGDHGLTSHQAFEFLMRQAAPLHPALGVLGFVKLVRSAEGIQGML
jgi:hypothetical protein